MPQISDNVIGVNLEEVITSAPSRKRRFRSGTTITGDDGRFYQYVIAGGAIASNNTVLNITASNGVYTAANSGGTSANASGVAVTTGQHFWARLPAL